MRSSFQKRSVPNAPAISACQAHKRSAMPWQPGIFRSGPTSRLPMIPAELSGLEAGELAAINLALVLRCPVLIDERLGRQVARRRGLTVIPAVAPILDQWLESGYFLSAALIKAVLSQAGEP